MPLRKNEYLRSLSSLWINWTFSIGAVVISILLSLVVKPVYVPPCMFLLVFFLVVLYKSNQMQSIPMCSHIVWVGIQSILWSAIIILIINLLNTRWLLGRFFDAGNLESGVPFITSLIIFPVCLIVDIISTFRMGHTPACQECKERHGFTLEEGFVGNFVHNEVRYQSRLLIYLSTFLTLVGWIYYFMFYINVNINTPDTFFFIIMPAALYAISVIFFTIRYSSMSTVVTDPAKATETHNATILRYLIVKGDFMLITEHTVKSMSHISRWDTPAIEKISFRNHIDTSTARHHFEHLSQYHGQYSLRAIYSNKSFSDDTNIFHFAVFLPEPLPGVDDGAPADNNRQGAAEDNLTNSTDSTPAEVSQLKLPGTWTTIYDINRLYRAGSLSPALASEINRIFKITMAWKTYDITGRRLYPVKNYRPTFRLRDFKDWDVDYNDLRWLSVSTNNQDRPFFTLRKAWRRIFK